MRSKGPSFAVAGPAIVPETIVIDHGKIYLSEHLPASVSGWESRSNPPGCGPAVTKGPVERFFARP